MSGITSLSTSLGRHWLSHLECRDIISFGQVCKAARTLASDNLVWKNCIEQTITGGPLTERMVTNHSKNYKALYRQLVEKSLSHGVGLSQPHIAGMYFCLRGDFLYSVGIKRDSLCINKADAVALKHLDTFEVGDMQADIHALAADERYIFVGYSSGLIQRVDQSSRALTTLQDAQGQYFYTISDLVLEETALYSAGGRNLIKWDKETGAAQFTKTHPSEVSCLDVDSERIYTGCDDLRVHIFAKASGEEIATVNLNRRIRSLAVDHSRIYVGHTYQEGPSFTVWDKESHEHLHLLDGPPASKNNTGITSILAKGRKHLYFGGVNEKGSHFSIRDKNSLNIVETLQLAQIPFCMAFNERTQTMWLKNESLLFGLDFTATPEEVWGDLQFSFKYHSPDLTYFKRLPRTEQEAVFKELYEIMKPWPAGSDTWQCAERAVMDTPRRATGPQIGDAIQKFLSKRTRANLFKRG